MRWRVTFRWWAAGSFALALAVRWLVWLRWYRDLELGFTDNLYYHESANLLADGHGFVNPFTYLTDGTLRIAAIRISSRNGRMRIYQWNRGTGVWR